MELSQIGISIKSHLKLDIKFLELLIYSVNCHNLFSKFCKFSPKSKLCSCLDFTQQNLLNQDFVVTSRHPKRIYSGLTCMYKHVSSYLFNLKICV